MSLSKVIEIARGELGVTESPPNSNREEWKPVKGYESRYEVRIWAEFATMMGIS